MSAYLSVFTILLLAGVPVALALGMGSAAYLLLTGKSHLLIAFPQRLITGIDQFVLLTIPLFILAGNLMNAGGITEQIIRCAQALVGRARGGLAAVNVVSSLLFSGINGTATGDASAVGTVMIPSMVKEGYRPAYAAAVTAVSSILGPLIPPSLTLILYGVLTGTSIAGLFLAGIVPGLLLAAALTAYVLFVGHRQNHPRCAPMSAGERFSAVVRALPALFLPVIIVGGIRFGAFTPTEAAAVAVIYALVAGGLFYRRLRLSGIVAACIDTATMTAAIMLIVAMASMTAFVFGYENIPAIVAGNLMALTDDPLVLLLLINAFLILLGLFLEPLAALILMLPILTQLQGALGLDPLHLGVIVCLNLVIGMITPPVGLCLFIVSSISGVRLEGVVRAALPMLAISFLVLALVTFVPALSLTLPRLLGG
jgi:tripartite ATP-independent transporter DctM subunit